jgi:ubiquinone/menaquinone biosynthesis C-methylase UbiE/uncharacterized protein YbaR (Trm112 family)
MNTQRSIYICPNTKTPLVCRPQQTKDGEVISGELVNDRCARYPISSGIPDLTFPPNLGLAAHDARSYYDQAASVYDDVAHLSFTIQHADETTTRQSFIDLLELMAGHRVLEVACGTGRDSENIAARLDETGSLFLQDLSRPMIERCRERLRRYSVPIEYSVGNACYLPYPNGYFDRVFSFGGLSVFGDIPAALREIVRVTRVGGKVVVGDESMAPWLYNTEYGRILLNNNPLFRASVPLEHIPVEARQVGLRWVVGGVYYLIDFSVGEGDPPANFDLQIPGKRGGTLRTRFYGRVEGVKPDTLDLAVKARDKSGKSMHDWLDEVVRQAAKRELGLP